MEWHKIDILRMSEIKRSEQRDYWSRDYRVIFNGDKRKKAQEKLVRNMIQNLLSYNDS